MSLASADAGAVFSIVSHHHLPYYPRLVFTVADVLGWHSETRRLILTCCLLRCRRSRSSLSSADCDRSHKPCRSFLRCRLKPVISRPVISRCLLRSVQLIGKLKSSSSYDLSLASKDKSVQRPVKPHSSPLCIYFLRELPTPTHSSNFRSVDGSWNVLHFSILLD